MNRPGQMGGIILKGVAWFCVISGAAMLATAAVVWWGWTLGLLMACA